MKPRFELGKLDPRQIQKLRDQVQTDSPCILELYVHRDKCEVRAPTWWHIADLLEATL